jgi:hypothetical protein
MNSAAMRNNLRMVQGLIQSLSASTLNGCPTSHILHSLAVLDTGLERIIERSQEYDLDQSEIKAREAEADKMDSWIAKAASNRRAFGA